MSARSVPAATPSTAGTGSSQDDATSASSTKPPGRQGDRLQRDHEAEADHPRSKRSVSESLRVFEIRAQGPEQAL